MPGRRCWSPPVRSSRRGGRDGAGSRVEYAHQVHLARPDVAGVEGDVSQTEEVLGQVAAPVAPEAEDAARLGAACSRPRPRRPARAPRAGAGGPALQRPARWRRVRHDDGYPGTAGEAGRADQGLFGREVPGAAAQWRMESQDGKVVLLREVVEVGALVGVPALVHHDLHPVEAGLGRPGIDPFEPEGV